MTFSRHALVTGGAGFIGSRLVDRLLGDGWRVTVVDNFDPFYGRATKCANIASHLTNCHYQLVEADIRDFGTLRTRLQDDYTLIIHLAAKAGVRPSIENPVAYQQVNVQGTQHLLELAKERGVRKFIFGSSSSVYGVNPNVPWREEDHVLLPISPYASTKVSGELLGHVYAHLYGIQFIALRFFTVYGPRQRPDLAIHKFAKRMLQGEPVTLYGDGHSLRDYTYVDDIVQGIYGAMGYADTPYEIINIGSHAPISLKELISALECVLGVKALIEYGPPHAGDVPQTWADIEKANRLLGYEPSTDLLHGLRCFATWIAATPAASPVMRSAETPSHA